MEKRNNVSGPGKKTTASRCSLFKGRKTTYNEKGRYTTGAVSQGNSEQEGGPGGEGSPFGWGVGRSGGGALSGDVG